MLLGFGRLLHRHHAISLKRFPHLKIHQEYKTTSLVVTTDLDREDIELHLDALVSQFNRAAECHVERFPGTDTWKITATHAGSVTI